MTDWVNMFINVLMCLYAKLKAMPSDEDETLQENANFIGSRIKTIYF